MKKWISKTIGNSNYLALLILSTALVVTAIPLKMQINQFTNLTSVHDGSSICFSRVVQTFTAKMVSNGGSPYTQTNFTGVTEECYADLLENFQSKFSESYKAVGSKLNKLANDIHWFHKKTNTSFLALAGGDVTDQTSNRIQNRFRELEETNDSLAESLEIKKYNLLTRFSLLGLICFGIIGLLVLSVAWLIRGERLNAKAELGIEVKAQEVLDEKTLDSQKIERIIANAFEFLDLKNCNELFRKYHRALLENKMKKFVNENEETKEPTSIDEIKQLREVQKSQNAVWTAESAREDRDDLERIQLEGVVSKVVEKLQGQLVHKGIILQVELEQDLVVWAKPEALIQVIHDSLCTTIKQFRDTLTDSCIQIRASGIGGTIVLKVSHNGLRFEKKFVSALKRKNSSNGLSTDFLILKEMMEDLEGKIDLKNFNDSSEIKLTFKKARNKEAKQLINLKKGSKKEIQAMLS